MKHIFAKPFELGVCFICGKPCDKTAYCHYCCALAFSDEKDKRIKEAKEDSKTKGL